MAYNLQPLITILEQILNPQQTLWIVDHNKPRLESLLQRATSLQHILDKSLLTNIEFLESQIRDAAHEAEDVIELHMVEQMLSNPEAVGLTFSTPDLQPVMRQLDCAMEQVAMLVDSVKSTAHGFSKGKTDSSSGRPVFISGASFSCKMDLVRSQARRFSERKTGSSSGTSFSRNVDSVRSKAVVGVDGYVMQLRHRLTGDMWKLVEEKTGSSSGAPSSRDVYSVKSKSVGDLMLSLNRSIALMEAFLQTVDLERSPLLELEMEMKQLMHCLSLEALMRTDGDWIDQLRSEFLCLEWDLMQLTASTRWKALVPIVGMGGLGKCTRARNLFENHAWATVLQDYHIRQLEIVPIVGMGGIGKTTLARKLYEDPSSSHFDEHAWATVSQDYDMKAILLSLLHCISGKKSRYHAGKKNHELKYILRSSLYGRRYMIVLDDIWSIKFWNEIREYFPDDNNGSRIVITTRESKVARHASSQSVQPVMQQLDSAMKQVVKLEKGKTGSSSGASFSRKVDSVRLKALVGVDGDLMQLRDRLTGGMKELEIVPIVGMGGIGKTALARKLFYEDPYIVSHFKSAHAWATVSQDYDMKAILRSLLHCISGKEPHQFSEIRELKHNLHESLWNIRYMIVLDDIWSIKFWDEIRMYFPDNNKGSRIVITTRESAVAKHASSQSVQHQMQLLNEFESWNLLRQEVFGDKEDCSHKLQGIGEKISRDCGGLPLAINVIGGLLSKVERSIGVWESIAENVASAIVEVDEQFSDILSLSYNHLPNHLKPCFLYIGAFPEDHRIEGSKLVRMWMGEMFVKSNGNKSLEEEAEACLKALVERNLIFVSEYEHLKPKYYGMHDLLRDLCIRKSNEDNFFSVGNGRESNADKFVYKGNDRVSYPRRMSVAKSYEFPKECMRVRSFISIGEGVAIFYLFRLVRVLDVMDFKFDEFPTEILKLVNLRFLAVWCNREIPRGISRLKNLQTLIAEMPSYYYVTSEIFEMSELRHLQLAGIIVIYDIYEEDMKTIAPNKLQMLCIIRISESLIRRGFFESIPDIKDLALCCNYAELTPGAVDLRHLHKLETLTIYPDNWWKEARDRLSTFRFPSGLRKLVVRDHVMSPSVMKTLCALPNLEVLHMGGCEFAREGDYDDDEEWEVAEGDKFRSLQVLHIQLSKLVCWRADETNFPRLRHLLLYDCNHLEEIPSGIGEISTLELIELRYCSDSAVASAKQIVEEQQSVYDNYTLQLRIK